MCIGETEISVYLPKSDCKTFPTAADKKQDRIL